MVGMDSHRIGYITPMLTNSDRQALFARRSPSLTHSSLDLRPALGTQGKSTELSVGR